MPELGAHLQTWMTRRFDWGGADCTLGFVSDWVSAVTGQDAGARWRGRYRSFAAMQRLLVAEGGLEAVYDGMAAELGWSRRETGRAGDVGLVVGLTRRTRAGQPSLSRQSRQLTGTICTGPRWAVFTGGGLLVAPANPVRIWGP